MTEKLISFSVTKYDRGVAKLWLGSIGTVFIFGLLVEGFAIFGLVFCALMLGLGAFYFNKTVWTVVDEVWDCGDHLKVIRSGQQREILFTDILEVNLTYPNHKHLITIETNASGVMDKNITFRATSGYPTFRSPKILSLLKQRVQNS